MISTQSSLQSVESPTSSCCCPPQTIANELLDSLLLYLGPILSIQKLPFMILGHSEVYPHRGIASDHVSSFVFRVLLNRLSAFDSSCSVDSRLERF